MPVIRLKVPATTANLGSGFDTLGMALTLYNIFTVKEILPAGEYSCEISGECVDELKDAKKNLLVTSYIKACEEWNVPAKGFAFESCNVVPCCIGGMTVSCWDGENLRYVRLPALPSDLNVIAAVPDFQVHTEDARKILPDSVPFKDAVFNVSHASILCAAWAMGRLIKSR